MAALIGPLLNMLLFLLIGQSIRYYPLKDRWRLSLSGLIWFYALIFTVQCAAFVLLRNTFAADYLGFQLYRALTGLIVMLVPFLLIKGSFFENLFLISLFANYTVAVFGLGNYVELTYGRAFALGYPYVLSTAVVTVLSLPLLPPFLRAPPVRIAA